MKPFVVLLVLLCALVASAQIAAPPTSITGKFHVCVDDSVRLFHNGELLHHGGIGTSISKEVTLSPGDRIVAQLHESGGGKRFKLLFLSSDQKSIIAFPRLAFRMLNDKVLVDFTAEDWGKWSKYAKPANGGADGFPMKTSADWVWGEGNDCALGALLAAEMIKPAPIAIAVARIAESGAAVLTVEALVDGPSTLIVRRDGLFWENGDNAKPGASREPTYVNETAWMPKWNVPGQERGFDRTDIHPLKLETLELSVELISNMKERGTVGVDHSRSPIQVKKRPNQIEVLIPDSQAGARWYKLVFLGRKR